MGGGGGGVRVLSMHILLRRSEEFVHIFFTTHTFEGENPLHVTVVSDLGTSNNNLFT